MTKECGGLNKAVMLALSKSSTTPHTDERDEGRTFVWLSSI